MLPDSPKSFNRGIGKVVSPSRTCVWALRKFGAVDPPVYDSAFEIIRPTGIPQYHLVGTRFYQRIVKRRGANGKGHTKPQATASAVMELAERYSCFKYLADRENFVTAALRDLPDNPFSLEDLKANRPDLGCFSSMSDARILRAPMRWYRGFRLDGRRLLLPMSVIAYLLEGTNGMASGNTLEESLLHGVCEVLERHCLTLIRQQKIATPAIVQSTIRTSIGRRVLDKLTALHQPVWVRDFSQGLGLPVIGVVRQVDASHCLISAGVATSPEEALIRAVTENSQADSPTMYSPVSRNSHCLQDSERISFGALPSIRHRDIRVELETIARKVARKRMTIYYVPTTDAQLDIPCVYAYISGTRHVPESESGRGDRNVLTAIVRECVHARRFRSALRYIRLGEQTDRERRGVYSFCRGCVALLGKRYRVAAANFQRALRHKMSGDEVRANCLLGLGVACVATRDSARAARYFRRVIREHPKKLFEHLDVGCDDGQWTEGGAFDAAADLYYEIRRRHCEGNSISPNLANKEEQRWQS